MKEEHYKEFCILFKEKLREILKPALGDNGVRSYRALTDILTNVILFEMNINKKPCEEIPKREVENIFEKAQVDTIQQMNKKQIAHHLIKKIKEDCVWSVEVSHIEERDYKDVALIILLQEFINKED